MPPETSDWQPLSNFQRLMLHWSTVRPFHVVDAVEALTPVRADDLCRAANTELAVSGVAFPVVDESGTQSSFRLAPPTLSVEQLVGDDLECLFSNELNRPFVRNHDPLIRLWVSEGSRPVIGMTWQHWPCDGFSAADLFRRILARYLGVPAAAPPRAVPRLIGWGSAAALGRLHGHLCEVISSLVRSWAVRVVPPLDDPAPRRQVRVVVLPADVLAPMRVRAARVGSTINDVFAATIGRAVAGAIGGGKKPRPVSLCNFVDLRPFVGSDLTGRWGQFLAFMVVHLPAPLLPLDDLVREVRNQSKRLKAGRWFFGSLFAFWLASRIHDWLPVGLARWLAPKLMPLSATLTNLRLPAAWAATMPQDQLGRYWSAVPTANGVPLTVSARTWGDQLTIVLTIDAPGPLTGSIEQVRERVQADLINPALPLSSGVSAT